MSRGRLVVTVDAAGHGFRQAHHEALAAGDLHDPDLEPEWEWNTRITAEAARAALAKGQTPHERFAIYEQLISAALEERKRAKIIEPAASTSGDDADMVFKMPYDNRDAEDPIISGFEWTESLT